MTAAVVLFRQSCCVKHLNQLCVLLHMVTKLILGGGLSVFLAAALSIEQDVGLL